MEVVEIKDQKLIGIFSECEYEKIVETMKKNGIVLEQYVKDSKLKRDDMGSFLTYYLQITKNYKVKKFFNSFLVPKDLDVKADTDKKIEIREFKDGKFVKYCFTGPTTQVKDAYLEMSKWAAEKKITLAISDGNTFEKYPEILDPSKANDKEIKTEIFWKVA